MTATVLGSDIVHAIVGHPDRFFQRTDLQTARFRISRRGKASCISGARAFVFCADLADGSTKAVRFPREPSTQFDDRYGALQTFVADNPACPLVETTLDIEGAVVGDSSYPVITMDWVEGKNLDDHIAAWSTRADCVQEYEQLAAAWRHSAAELERRSFAHGDIHAGNILVRPGSRSRGISELILVDYDCVWLPTVSTPSVEGGKPAFRHPQAGSTWNRTMDAFPNTLVYLSLRAIAEDPELCRTYGHKDGHLLFSHRDIADPAGSEVFQRLLASRAADVRELAAVAAEWLRQPADRYPSLEAVLSTTSQSGVVLDLTDEKRVLNDWPPRAPQSRSDTADSLVGRAPSTSMPANGWRERTPSERPHPPRTPATTQEVPVVSSVAGANSWPKPELKHAKPPGNGPNGRQAVGAEVSTAAMLAKIAGWTMVAVLLVAALGALLGTLGL